jgi:Tfp pilus assembly PilM family ATPase
MSRLSFSLTDADLPSVAVEIASHRVSALSLDHRGGRAAVSAHASEPLPDGALVPSLTAANVVQPEVVAAAVARVLERVGRARRIGLVVPDPVAKVSLVHFEQVPARAADLDQLIRWQVRKTAPFPIDEAQVSFVPGVRQPQGQEFIVTLARQATIAEYESLCTRAGAHAGLVDISTFNVINAVLAAGAPPIDPATGAGPDWLLVNVGPEWASLAILRGADLIFFRSRVADGEETLADLVHQTAMYYEDRLQGPGFTRVLLSGASRHTADKVDELRVTLGHRLGATVDNVDPRNAAALTDRIAATADLLDTLTPLVGMLLRRQTVMVP